MIADAPGHSPHPMRVRPASPSGLCPTEARALARIHLTNETIGAQSTPPTRPARQPRSG